MIKVYHKSIYIVVFMENSVWIVSSKEIKIYPKSKDQTAFVPSYEVQVSIQSRSPLT